MAIPLWVGAVMTTGDGFGHRWGRNGELRVTVGLLPGLQEYWRVY